MTSHHAVLVSSVAPLVFDPLSSLGLELSVQYQLPQFGIDDVRQLISDAYRRPAGEATEQTLCVATEFITEEAQQALLKIIEEPPESTRFVFVIPMGYTLLATLESRFERREITEAKRDTTQYDAFVAASYADRLARIEQSVKSKDHAWQADVKFGLLSYLEQSAHVIPGKQLVELEFVVRLLLTRGASNKFLLEHLALTLPVRRQA